MNIPNLPMAPGMTAPNMASLFGLPAMTGGVLTQPVTQHSATTPIRIPAQVAKEQAGVSARPKPQFDSPQQWFGQYDLGNPAHRQHLAQMNAQNKGNPQWTQGYSNWLRGK